LLHDLGELQRRRRARGERSWLDDHGIERDFSSY
jgi:hypothetical protein